MSRLSLVLSVLALVVGVAALAYPQIGREETVLDQAALADGVRQVLEAEPALIAPAAPAATEVATPETIGPAVRQYLLDNPEVLEEVIAALEAKREAGQATAQKEAVASNRAAIEEPAFSTPIGNAEGNVTVVEFFDYNCGYCKRMLPEMVSLIEQDENLRVVLKDWPVLGEDSQAAARVALGVRQVAPESYYEFHRTLLGQRGRIGKNEALAVAKELGIDTAAVEATLDSEEVNAVLRENFRLGDALGLRGTPSYVIGDKVFMGAVPRDQIEAQIAVVRDEGCTNC